MRGVAALLATCVLASLAPAQATLNRYTEARPPDRDELNRANLRLAWSTTLPVEGYRDGIATVQLLGNQLVIRLRSGFLAVYDAATGRPLWQVHPGQPYPPIVHEVAATDRYILAIGAIRLHAYDRATGREEWTYELPTIPSAAPSADNDRVYMFLSGNRMTTFNLPARAEAPPPKDAMLVSSRSAPKYQTLTELEAKANVDYERIKPANVRLNVNVSYSSDARQLTPSVSVLESIAPPYRLNSNTRQTSASVPVLQSVVPPYRLNSNSQTTPSIVVVNQLTRIGLLSSQRDVAQPIHIRWTYVAVARFSQPPLITSERIVGASTGTQLVAASKLGGQFIYDYQTAADISATTAQFGDTLYVPTADGSLYAFDALRGKVLWRFTAGGAIARKPAVTADDIYVVTAQAAMYRLNRQTGDLLWTDPRSGLERPATNVTRFVASNDRYVYAIDGQNRLVTLDRARGSVLATVDSHDFTFALANDHTDRVYLMANNGTVVCLHDRSLALPVDVRGKEYAPPAPTEMPKETPKPPPPLPGKPPEAKPPEAKPPVAKPPKKDDKKGDKKGDKKDEMKDDKGAMKKDG